jgi:hypothetical protein
LGFGFIKSNEVVEFFVKNGVPSKHLSAVGYGDTRPLVANTTLENRARNRRIDIVLTNAVVNVKKSKQKEPTTIDIIGEESEIKERTKIFETERELGRANELNKKAKESGKEKEGSEKN